MYWYGETARGGKSLSAGSRTCEAREEVEMCSLIAGANKIVPHPVPCSERY